MILIQVVSDILNQVAIVDVAFGNKLVQQGFIIKHVLFSRLIVVQVISVVEVLQVIACQENVKVTDQKTQGFIQKKRVVDFILKPFGQHAEPNSSEETGGPHRSVIVRLFLGRARSEFFTVIDSGEFSHVDLGIGQATVSFMVTRNLINSHQVDILVVEIDKLVGREG